MKPFESYKKTNITWLRDIPIHWKFERIGTLFSERKTKVSDKDYAPLSVTKRGILPQLATAAKSDDGNNRKMVVVGNFVINSRSDRKGSSGISLLTGSVSLINLVLEPRQENNSQFMHYLLKSNSFIEEYYRNGRGIVADLWTTRFSEMKTIMLPVPPRVEQDQIVRFLDWKISKINKLIKAKKEQIALLNEQKQSIINKAITKGLDDTVPMKDSGVGWIGLIPSTWKLGKIKKYFKIQKRIAGKEGYDVLSVTQNGIRIKDISKNEGQMAMNYSGYQFVYPEDFVMNHMDLLTGYVDCSSVFGVTSPDYRVFKLVNSEKCMKEYVLFIFQLCYKRKIFYGLGQGAAAQGRWRLPKDNFYNFTFPLPPLNEQQKIVTEINGKVMGIEKALNAITVEVEYIMEYKTALISSVITGKVDVRDVVVPDFEIEDEVLEEVTEAFDDEIKASEVDE